MDPTFGSGLGWSSLVTPQRPNPHPHPPLDLVSAVKLAELGEPLWRVSGAAARDVILSRKSDFEIVIHVSVIELRHDVMT
jgi:hypothetical protein